MTDSDRPTNLHTDAKPHAEWFRKPWQERMAFVEDMVREISLQTDPQEMVNVYGERMMKILPSDQRISLSRRDLDHPYVRVTRVETDVFDLNPWKHRDSLPV